MQRRRPSFHGTAALLLVSTSFLPLSRLTEAFKTRYKSEVCFSSCTTLKMTTNNKVLIVRHSERLDEVDETAWSMVVRSEQGKKQPSRDLFSHLNDPILTPNGHKIAEDAGISLRNLLTGNAAQQGKFDMFQFLSLTPTSTGPIEANHVIDAIYSSRLRRSWETAYRMALQLNVPMYISSGLALTAKAVESKNCYGGSDEKFEFHTMEEIRSLTPGVQVFSCDEADLDVATATAAAESPADYARDVNRLIPVDNWLSALAAVARRHPFSVVVAHRESIRNLAGGLVMRAPYCCMGLFDFEMRRISEDGTVSTEPAAATGTKEVEQVAVTYRLLLDKDGNRIG